jgi:formiminotetrahydrofolate cyclodeaminase
MNLLIDKKVKDFCDALSSKEPAPGGGSTAALSGALGASLTMMVGNLTFGKKAFEALEQDCRNLLMQNYEKIGILRTELMTLIDEDTRAFNRYMEAVKMPKDTEAERADREKAMETAGLDTLEVPLKTARICLEILKLQMPFVLHGNKNAVSDIGVGALLAYAGVEGAALNVKINLPGIRDDVVKTDAGEKIENCLNEARVLETKIQAMVQQILNL